jgi:hypothetical protein
MLQQKYTQNHQPLLLDKTKINFPVFKNRRLGRNKSMPEMS